MRPLSTPKRVVFDLGNVLVRVDHSRSIATVAARSTRDARVITDIVRRSRLAQRYHRGEISSTDFFREIKKEIGFAGTTGELRQAWCDLFTPLTENIAYARELAVRVPLAILSNTNEAHIRYLEQTYSFFDLFRWRIYSHVERRNKPHKNIFRLAAQRMQTTPRHCFLIDDGLANIQAARSVGYQTLNLRSPHVISTAMRHRIARFIAS